MISCYGIKQHYLYTFPLTVKREEKQFLLLLTAIPHFNEMLYETN